MKKITKWLAAISIAVFAIDWGFIGLKLLDGNYDITASAYIAAISLVIFVVCVLYVRFTNRCPHCGKMNQTLGKFCPYCGKEIN